MVNGNSIGVVIPAAGSGNRFGGGIAKQFLDLDNKPVLARTLDAFESNTYVDWLCIAGSAEGIEQIEAIVSQYRYKKVVWIGPGGMYRQDSVWNGIQPLLSKQASIILVHDAVRPFVSQDTINAIIQTAIETGAVIPGVRLKDTVKIVNSDGRIQVTPQREHLYSAQTPQGFRTDILIKAYEQARKDNFIGTDEASLVERIHVNVRLVEGSYENIKITTPEDLEFARIFLSHRVKAGT